MRLNFKYEYTNKFGPSHLWTCVGRHIALSLSIKKIPKFKENESEEFCGGLEIHYRSPPEYKKDDAPDHEKCWLLKQPCWHDGTSLYVSEFIIPFWQSNPTDIERMFKFLEGEYAVRLKDFYEKNS